MIRFISYIDENGKKRLKKSDEWLKKEGDDRRKIEEKKKLLDKRKHHNHWLKEWLDKKRIEKLNKYIEHLRLIIPKEKLDERLIRRFFSKVDITNNWECWNWIRHIDTVGYGRFYIDGINDLAHRISFIIHYGEIQQNMQILHNCDNRKCVNPNHLFIGTNLDNVNDRVVKNRSYRPKGELSPLSKLTKDQVIEIRERYKKEISISSLTKKFDIVTCLAKEFNVKRQQIIEIIRNRHWVDENYKGIYVNRLQKRASMIREEYKKHGMTYSGLSKKYGVCNETIRLIVNNYVLYDENYIRER